MKDFYTFDGIVYDQFDDPRRPTDDEELAWLRANPTQVAHILRLEMPAEDSTGGEGLSAVFQFSVRVLDDREAEGWRLARFDLPATAYRLHFARTTLDDDWPKMAGRTDLENMFVLSALSEATYTGHVWTGIVLRSLVVPDLSELDPEGWGQDFKPNTLRAAD